ncbi:MAG: signal transduction histidine kinase [Flavobacteriales bacterium]|jgi:signal transduction histidine kinase
MRRLAISLIVEILVVVVGLGWLLNQVHSLTNDNSNSHSSSVVIYERFVHDLANSIEGNAKFSLSNWNETSHLSASLIHHDDFPLPLELEKQLSNGEILALESDGEVSLHYLLTSSNQTLSVNLPPLTEIQEHSKLNLILTLTFYLGIVLFILIWLSPLMKQLIDLRKTALSFGKGKLDSRIKITRMSYISEIELEFNRMADRIQSLIQDNKLLGRAVSHDLKTPLARLRFGLDALAETNNPELKEKYSARVSNDIDEMETLINHLLDYARIDEGRIQFDNKSIEVNGYLTQLFSRQRDDDINVKLICPSDSLHVFGDKNMLAMLFNNIVNNATRFAVQHVTINIRSCDTLSCICIDIEDDGKGIDDDHKDHIFKPFWKTKDETEYQGHGMGLAIAVRIVEWHKGTISIGDSDSLGGAKFSVTLPVNERS